MEWSDAFYAIRRGDGCPLCAQGRPEELTWGLRFHGGETCDAYLQKAAVQRGYAIVVWRGRHVVDPTELDGPEAAAFWRELLVVGAALERRFRPVKLNYELFGNELPHLHAHVLPRYANDPRPVWPFPVPDQDPPPHPDRELRADAEALRALLPVE